MIFNPPILKAIPAFGTDDAPRYAIQNLVDDQIWTGKDFSPDWDRAMLYAAPNDACADMRQIMVRVFDHQPLAIYEAPTRIEVFGDVSMRQVQQFLSRASILRVRNSEYGNGPAGSLAIPSIHWAEMKKAPQ